MEVSEALLPNPKEVVATWWYWAGGLVGKAPVGGQVSSDPGYFLTGVPRRTPLSTGSGEAEQTFILHSARREIDDDEYGRARAHGRAHEGRRGRLGPGRQQPRCPPVRWATGTGCLGLRSRASSRSVALAEVA